MRNTQKEKASRSSFRSEITIETHEVTIIRFGRRRSREQTEEPCLTIEIPANEPSETSEIDDQSDETAAEVLGEE